MKNEEKNAPLPTWGEQITHAVGENITKYREYLGWSAQELSNKTTEAGATVARSSIAKLEAKTKKTVTYQELVPLAYAFGLPVEMLVINLFDPSQPYLLAPKAEKLPGYIVSELLENPLVTYRPNTALTSIWLQLNRFTGSRTFPLSYLYDVTVTLPRYVEKGKALGLTNFVNTLQEQIKKWQSPAYTALIESPEDIPLSKDVKLWELDEMLFLANVYPSDLWLALDAEVRAKSQEGVGNMKYLETLIGIDHKRTVTTTKLVSFSDIPDSATIKIYASNEQR